MAANVLRVACAFHQHYRLCSRRCERKKFCLMNSLPAPVTATTTHSPAFYFIGEERRSRPRRDRRQWMMPPLHFRMVG